MSDPERVELPCMTKGCDVCGPRVRARLVGHFVTAFRPLGRLWFVTLTCDQAAYDAALYGALLEERAPALHVGPYRLADYGEHPDGSRKYVNHCWQKFRKRLARRGPCEFVGAFEQHKTGYYHLHVVCSSPVEERELRELAFASGFGAVVDVQCIEDGEGEAPGQDAARALGYVLKYATKDSDGRLLASQGFGYHSALGKAQRDAWLAAERGRDPEGERSDAVSGYFERRAAARDAWANAGVVIEYVPGVEDETARELTRVVALHPVDEVEWVVPAPGPRPRALHVLTAEDRRRYNRLDFVSRTFTYRERRKREGVVVVHTYDREAGTYHRTTLPLPAGRATQPGDNAGTD